MSLRIDSADYFAGLVIGNTGLGVLAEAIPSAGDSGASYLFNDLTLPADAGKEIRGEILTVPSSGTFVAYEDGSFEFSGAADGAYSFTYQLYVDGVAVGSPATVSLTVGTINAAAVGTLPVVSLTAPSATASGTTVIHGEASGVFATILLTAPNGSASGTVAGDGSASGALPTISLTVPLATATGTTGGGMTLTQADVDAIAAAVWTYATRVITGPTPDQNADALLSRNWP